MTQAYTSKLSLKTYPSNNGPEKIDGSIFEMFGMVLASFQIKIGLNELDFSKKVSYWPILV